MNIKGVIFDLDGTLLDSMFVWDTIGSDYLLSRSIEPEERLNEKFKTMSIVQAAEYYQTNYGITDSIEDIISGVNDMIDYLYSEVVKLKDGVAEMLEILKNKDVKMYVATATDRYMVEAALKHNGISDYFYGILTCTEVGHGKDSPVIYEKALELLGTKKNDTIVFEDAIHAIKTAKAAGFTVAGVYDKSSQIEQSEIIKIADYYISSFKNWSELYD